jgi:hypothetical protein
MPENSDQFATPEEEAAFHQEVIETDAEDQHEEEDLPQEEEVEESEEEAEEVKPKKPGYVEIKDPAVKERVDQLTREKHEALRKEKAAAQKAEQLARELEELKRPAPPKEVPVPTADPVTDPELFARQQQERDKYIREHTKYESETESRKQAATKAEEAKQAALVENYRANMARLKINPVTLDKASAVCSQYGIGNDLVEYLLEDQDGPAIVLHLGDNPETLAELVSMRPAKAAAFIEKEIRAKLNVKKQSKAPPPPTKVSGVRQSKSSTADGWSIS